MTDKIVVFNTCSSEEEAARVARHLVENRAAACVSIIPQIASVYRWEGAVEQSTEWLLVIKTRRDLFARLSAELRRVHSYQVPELIALPVVDGLPDYLAWLDKETAS
jgi:periplasmic divalent cation tolerance protein